MKLVLKKILKIFYYPKFITKENVIGFFFVDIKILLTILIIFSLVNLSDEWGLLTLLVFFAGPLFVNVILMIIKDKKIKSGNQKPDVDPYENFTEVNGEIVNYSFLYKSGSYYLSISFKTEKSNQVITTHKKFPFFKAFLFKESIQPIHYKFYMDQNKIPVIRLCYYRVANYSIWIYPDFCKNENIEDIFPDYFTGFLFGTTFWFIACGGFLAKQLFI